MTTEKLTKEQRRRILTAANIIREEFMWVETKEGYDYWEDVYDALRRIANSNLEPVEKEIELNSRKYRLVEE